MNNLFNRCINRLLSSVDDDPDFPSAEKLVLIRQNRVDAESPELLYGRLLLELKASQQLGQKAKKQEDLGQFTLIAWRERHKLTTVEAAKRLDVDYRIYCYYETGYLKVSDNIIARLFRQERHLALTQANPTLLRAAARIQIDFPDDFIGDDVHGIEEKLRTGHLSLRTKYRRQIIEAAMEYDLGRGRPLPNYAVGPWGCNPLAGAIKKGAQLVESVPPEPELAFPRKAEEKAKPESLSAIQLTLIWVAIILCVQVIKRFIE